MATSHSYTQFLGTEKVISDKTVCDWVKCVGPEGQMEMLRPYVAGIAINLGNETYYNSGELRLMFHQY